MKINFLSYVAIVGLAIFTACQQEEVKPDAQAEAVPLVDENSGVKGNDNGRLISVIGIESEAENGDVCNNSWRFTAVGTNEYCLSVPMAVKWTVRFHDAAGNITSEYSKWHYGRYSCIEPGEEYISTDWLATPSRGSQVAVSFKARFYRKAAPGDSYAWRYTGNEAETSIARERFVQCGQ